MPRRRVGVALVLDPPVASEVDGLRRALGDGALGRVAPHLTLVSPLNLRAGDLDGALARLRSAAASAAGPLRLTLGPPATFLPDNPVLYLPVGGDLAPLRALRTQVAAAPLERRVGTWPWVPHVTIADELAAERIEAALVVLDRYQAVADVDRVVLLEERDRRWEPLADAALGPPAVVGRGGVELTLVRGRVVGPDLLADDMGAQRWQAGGASVARPPAMGAGRSPAEGAAALPVASAPVVLTALRGGRCVGGAAAWWDRGRPRVAVHVAPDERGAGVGSHLLSHLEVAVRRAGWEAPVLYGSGPAGFYRARTRWVVGEDAPE